MVPSSVKKVREEPTFPFAHRPGPPRLRPCIARRVVAANMRPGARRNRWARARSLSCKVEMTASSRWPPAVRGEGGMWGVDDRVWAEASESSSESESDTGAGAHADEARSPELEQRLEESRPRPRPCFESAASESAASESSSDAGAGAGPAPRQGWAGGG